MSGAIAPCCPETACRHLVVIAYVNVVQRSLDDVPELWDRGRISVAREHLTIAITESIVEVGDEFRVAFPGVPILVGGKAFGHAERERAERLSDVPTLASMGELGKWVKENSQSV